MSAARAPESPEPRYGGTDPDDGGGTFSAKLRSSDRPFLDAERFRLVREAFVEDNRFTNLGVGELVSRLLEELRRLRRAALACECGACDGIVDPDATLEDPAEADGDRDAASATPSLD